MRPPSSPSDLPPPRVDTARLPPGSQRPSRARRIGIGALATLAALLLLLAVAEVAGWPFLRLPLQQQLQQRLNAPVTLGTPFRLSLLVNPGVEVGSVLLGAPAGLGVPHLLEAQDLDVRWRWADLSAHRAGEPWRLRSVAATRLDLQLVRLANGRASWPATPPPPPGEAALPRLRELPLQADTLAVADGRVLYRDALTHSDVLARLKAGQDDGSPQAFTAAVQGQWRKLPVRLQASAGGVTGLFDTSAATAMVPVAVRGRIGSTDLSFRGVAADVLSARALRGSLLVRGPSLAAAGDALGITLPTTPAFRLATALTHDDGLWSVSTTRAQVGGSRLQADLVYDGRAQTPLLTGRLGGELLRLKDLGPAIGTAMPADTPALAAVLEGALDDLADAPAAPARASPQATTRARPDRVLPDRRFDLPTLRVMDADVQVAIATLDLGDDAAIEPMRQLQTHLTLRQGVLTLADLRAVAAGGQVSGSTQLNAATVGKPAQWKADLRFNGMKVEQWLRALQREGRPLMTGRLAAQLQVRGVGTSTAELLSTLQGQAAARLNGGSVSHLVLEMAGLDVAQALGVLVRGDRALTLTCFDVQSQIERGVMQLSHAVADTRDSTLRITGQIDLGEETLALRTVVKPKDFSPFSLRAPLLVGGTLATPVVGIEGRRLAPRLAAAAALAAIAGPAGLLPFLEFGSDAPAGQDPCLPAR